MVAVLWLKNFVAAGETQASLAKVLLNTTSDKRAALQRLLGGSTGPISCKQVRVVDPLDSRLSYVHLAITAVVRKSERTLNKKTCAVHEGFPVR